MNVKLPRFLRQPFEAWPTAPMRLGPDGLLWSVVALAGAEVQEDPDGSIFAPAWAILLANALALLLASQGGRTYPDLTDWGLAGAVLAKVVHARGWTEDPREFLVACCLYQRGDVM